MRLALEALGPIFVKFGQILSTRRDLIPADVADELIESARISSILKGQTAQARFPGLFALALVASGLLLTTSMVAAATIAPTTTTVTSHRVSYTRCAAPCSPA